ncbi:hypothetical protein GRX03_06930 [Halovenus sp. WSH3]|uniref:DUF7993 domain-containing protein n=1 Tax=Halovenus carboxidivorans TaxID=2692199 RepID=A0A6B0TDR8_9EURY|nr:hypothetical protein [Halovenus carboxidivorans]MXR51339.1 hypothetical protein [Halovenus carboxidivorans]
MVEDAITDGKRIAQLLASELTGLETGPFDRVTVTDADAEAMPSDSGTLAYRISVAGSDLAAVTLYPEYVQLEFDVEPTVPESAGELLTEDPTVLTVTSGAEVKRAVDLLRATAEQE